MLIFGIGTAKAASLQRIRRERAIIAGAVLLSIS
jgi:hypothetical protein